MKIAKPKLVYSILTVSTIVIILFLVTIIFPEFVSDSPTSSSVTTPTEDGGSTTPTNPPQPNLDELAQ